MDLTTYNFFSNNALDIFTSESHNEENKIAT